MQNSTQSENKLRWWDILAASLLFLCLFIATLRLLSTRWTSNLSLVQSIAFLGAILGLALGQSIFSRKVSFLFSVAYGVIIIPWRLGLLMDAEIGWVERLVSLWGRLVNIIQALLTKEPVTDSLLFLLLMSCLFWMLSVHAGFVITRYAHPWKAVLPTGVAILIIHSFDPLLPSRSWFVAFFLFFALLLIARLVYLRKRQQWKQTNIHTPSDVSFDFSRIAVAATIILVLFAWNVPVLAGSLGPVSKVWVDITRPWRSLKERFEFAFASLRASVGMVTDLYGDSMTLGTGTPLGDKVVLEVEAPNITLEGTRLFWKARVYDIYEDGRWQSSYAIKQVITPNSSDLYVPGYEYREDITLSIQVQDSVSLLYTASQPLWVSRPATALVLDNSDGTVDIGALSVNEYIRPGEVYETRSAVSAVTIKELREAGTDYPQWILDRYLQLPENLTPRTHELARSIAEGYDTPYDIANAVTEYLRENITYKPVINKAPAGREAIDWFLFDLKEGYCNYYASSEVILLRSLGIPARLAVGFSQGERLLPTIPGHDEGLEGIPLAEWVVSYVVRQKNAHAWPEVFFPEIGWVEFEPTSSQDALIRLSGEEYPLNPSDYSPEERDRNLSGELLDEGEFPEVDIPPEVSTTVGFWTPKSIIIMLLGLLLFVVLFFVIRRIKRNPQINPTLERWATQIPRQIEKSFLRLGITPPRLISHWAAYLSLPRLSRAYLEINKALKRLGESPDLYDTPSERVMRLCDVLPGSKDAALHLLNEYQTAMYSLHHADEDIAYQAGKEIRQLSLRVKLNKWLERFREPSPSASLE